ncbi:MAG: hypothetical protein C4K60_05150 [Ideonella sp. MAG2]|nr:MAG: hypothetical protein C4K60_05150 [Ideonella sp. MAG2]
MGAMMRTPPLLLGLLLALAALEPRASQAAEPLYLVVSSQHPARSLSQKEVLALFTGRSRTLADGTAATPLDQQRDSSARASFYLALTGMDIARINSYWARLHFTGQVQPPQALSDDASVIQRLRSDPNAIGYLTAEPKDPAVRVVLRLP